MSSSRNHDLISKDNLSDCAISCRNYFLSTPANSITAQLRCIRKYFAVEYSNSMFEWWQTSLKPIFPTIGHLRQSCSRNNKYISFAPKIPTVKWKRVQVCIHAVAKSNLLLLSVPLTDHSDHGYQSQGSEVTEGLLQGHTDFGGVSGLEIHSAQGSL